MENGLGNGTPTIPSMERGESSSAAGNSDRLILPPFRYGYRSSGLNFNQATESLVNYDYPFENFQSIQNSTDTIFGEGSSNSPNLANIYYHPLGDIQQQFARLYLSPPSVPPPIGGSDSGSAMFNNLTNGSAMNNNGCTRSSPSVPAPIDRSGSCSDLFNNLSNVSTMNNNGYNPWSPSVCAPIGRSGSGSGSDPFNNLNNGSTMNNNGSPNVSAPVGDFGSDTNNNGYDHPFIQRIGFGTSNNSNSMNGFGHRNRFFQSNSSSYPSASPTYTLRNRIHRSNGEKFNRIFQESIDDLVELSLCPIGYTTVTALIEKSSIEQRNLILQKLTNSGFQQLCTNDYGSRVMQKLLELLSSNDQIYYVIHHLTSIAVPLAKTSNGNRVILSCLVHVPRRYNEILLAEIANNCADIARDKHGCCILQQIIRYSSGNLRDKLVHDIIINAVQLADDPYGNYPVQFLLDMNNPMITQNLIRHLQRSFMELSFGKSGSHVVEKCLARSSPAQAEIIVNELINHPNIHQLFVDCCGNFVVQMALRVSRDEVRNKLVRLIDNYRWMMSSNKFGQKVLQFVEGKRNFRNRTHLKSVV